jgi:hypothetical protein
MATKSGARKARRKARPDKGSERRIRCHACSPHGPRPARRCDGGSGGHSSPWEWPHGADSTAREMFEEIFAWQTWASRRPSPTACSQYEMANRQGTPPTIPLLIPPRKEAEARARNKPKHRRQGTTPLPPPLLTTGRGWEGDSTSDPASERSRRSHEHEFVTGIRAGHLGRVR